LKLQKKPVKMGSSINHKEEVWLKVKVITSGPEESKLFGELWKGIYDTISALVEGEMPDGAEFLKMMEMKVEEKEDKLELIIKSSSPDLNLLLNTIVQSGDRIFKT
jgi:hypothetical protein